MHQLMEKLARFLALLGGITLVVLILLICASVLGRLLNGVMHSDALQAALPGLAEWVLALGVGPINGDYEIVEAGMAFAIFAFLPICQITGAHASVDIFAAHLPPRASRVLRLVIEGVFAAVLVLLAWQLTLGGMSKFRSGQTTLLLEFPVWWSYAASIVAMWAAALVGAYIAAARGADVFGGRPFPGADEGSGH